MAINHFRDCFYDAGDPNNAVDLKPSKSWWRSNMMRYCVADAAEAYKIINDYQDVDSDLGRPWYALSVSDQNVNQFLENI